MSNAIEDYRISAYRELEIVALRKAIFEWIQVAQPPRWVEKHIKDADLVRNEIKKIEQGLVK